MTQHFMATSDKTNTKIEAINYDFFGTKKTNRYLIDVYRECIEKLIVANVLIEVWAGTKRHHKHTVGKNCNFCAVFYQIYYSCIDSLYLHIRLLFSEKEPLLAASFLKAVMGLNIQDFEKHYNEKYGYKLSKTDKKAIASLLSSAPTAQADLSKLYLKRVEPYQSFSFHHPDDGKYYAVKTTTESHEGVRVVTHTKSSKFSRDLRAAKEMLDLFGSIVRQYLKVSSTYFHALKIYPESYVLETCKLLGVQLDEKALSTVVLNAEKNTEGMIHVLECSGGLHSHNGLVFAKILPNAGTNTDC